MPDFYFWCLIPVLRHTHSDVCTYVCRITYSVLFPIVDISIAIDRSVSKVDSSAFVSREMYQMHIKFKKFMNRVGIEYRPVFAIILGVLEVLLKEVCLFISMLFSVCSIIKGILYESDEFVGGITL